ncbi:MAG: hypothetical protein GY787_23365 [Alteromonadales bacterium]|nr:hypothetical protein [Alteromonadales bacterium]
MTKIPTLYEKLKPSVKAELNKSQIKYGSTIRNVIAKLESTHFVGDLTINDMKTVHLFSSTGYVNQTGLEFMWGEKIFDNYEGND